MLNAVATSGKMRYSDRLMMEASVKAWCRLLVLVLSHQPPRAEAIQGHFRAELRHRAGHGAALVDDRPLLLGHDCPKGSLGFCI